MASAASCWPRVRFNSAFGGAVDAVTSCRLGLQPGGGDRLPAVFAESVGAALDFAQGVLDLVEGLFELGGQRLRLAPLGRDLAGIGEVRVVRQSDVAEAQLVELAAQLVALLLELGAQIRRGIGGHEGSG